MDDEIFYPITQQDYDLLKATPNRVYDYAHYGVERSELNKLTRLSFIKGIDERPQHIGYVDIWDVLEADQGLYLRHYAHDSKD